MQKNGVFLKNKFLQKNNVFFDEKKCLKSVKKV